MSLGTQQRHLTLSDSSRTQITNAAVWRQQNRWGIRSTEFQCDYKPLCPILSRNLVQCVLGRGPEGPFPLPQVPKGAVLTTLSGPLHQSSRWRASCSLGPSRRVGQVPICSPARRGLLEGSGEAGQRPRCPQKFIRPKDQPVKDCLLADKCHLVQSRRERA